MSNHVTLDDVTHTQRPLFTVHEISVNVNMCFHNHAIAIRKIQFEFLKSGNTKVVPRKTVYRHDHVDLQQRLGRCLALIRQTPK